MQQNVDRLADSDDVRQVVVLPDIHLGRLINNGCAAATVDLIYPEAVGGDIGCGFSAIPFKSPAQPLREDANAQEVIRRLYQQVPALKQRGAPPLPAR